MVADLIRVLVVDDHALFRRGVVELLVEQPDFFVVGDVNNPQDALVLAERHRPQIVLLDVHMPAGRGIDIVQDLKRVADTRVIMLTISDEDEDLLDALAAGADGYLLKSSEPEELCQAIRQVAAGRSVLSPDVTAQVMRAAARARQQPPPVTLSEREQQVLSRLATGATTSEIATSLVISESTVKTHIRHILEKLEATNRAEAVGRAVALGLLKPD